MNTVYKQMINNPPCVELFLLFSGSAGLEAFLWNEGTTIVVLALGAQLLE